jgi:hypothetical protein
MSQRIKYRIEIDHNTRYTTEYGDFFQAFVIKKSGRDGYYCVGKHEAIGGFALSNKKHYKAKSRRELIGTIKKHFKNVKRMPDSPLRDSIWEGEL